MPANPRQTWIFAEGRQNPKLPLLILGTQSGAKMKTTVRSVRCVEIDMSQPGRAAAFYKDVWHLTEVERRDGSIYFRGTGPHHHILAIHPATKGFAIRRLTFDAADRDTVHALHKAVTAAGC